MLRLILLATTLVSLTGTAAAQQYRGMPAGWPNYAAGYPASASVNMAGYANPYVAARPVYGVAPLSYYAARPAYPAAAAYHAPAVSQAPSYGAQTTYAAPTTAQYAPQAVTAYSPTTAYAPANSYAVSPSTTGDTAFAYRAYYGQAGAINLAQPTQAYRTYYAQVPVTYYRPVTAYQPITGATCMQPVQPANTCLQPIQGTECQARRWPLLDWLHSWCRRNTCTTNYCGTAPSGCGTPYYPVVPVNPIPSTTAPVIIQPGVTAPSTIPVTPAPSIRTPIVPSPTVPPPPTRIGPTTIGPATTTPADTRPQLGPGTLPSTTAPGQFNPGVTQPSPSIPPTPGPGTSPSIPSTPINPGTSPSIPRTEYYPPSDDPYRGPATREPRFGTEPSPSGAPSRFGEEKEPASEPQSNNSLRFAPPSNSTFPSGVRVVPDLERANEPPTNRAPDLIDPRDRNAAAPANRWAVVPAIWPTKQDARLVADQGRVIQSTPSRHLNERTDFTQTSSRTSNRGLTAVNRTEVTESWDDSGWSSGR